MYGNDTYLSSSSDTFPFPPPPYHSSSTPVFFPLTHFHRPSIIPALDDRHLSLLVPVFFYWACSAFWALLDFLQLPYFERHRIHESAEVTSRNRVTRAEVVKAVVVQHAIQTLLGLVWLEEAQDPTGRDFGAEIGGYERVLGRAVTAALGVKWGARYMQTYGPQVARWMYWWGVPCAQFLWAFFIMDTWQYFWHRLCHTNRFLYKRFHSWHHRLYVPYAYGALYNHPLEGFVFDSLGAVVSQALAGMTTRQAVILFGVSTAKTVDDHCGYALPWDPFQMLCGNNADYHDIHHQTFGIKKNFAQPYFTHWDAILGTRMTRAEVPKRYQRAPPPDPYDGDEPARKEKAE